MPLPVLMQFKPSPLTEFPNSLYRYFTPEFIRTRQIELYQGALTEIQTTGTLTPDTLEVLHWYARILEYILRIPELDGKVKAMLSLESPASGFNAVIADYSSATSQILELSLLSKPEYVCKLLLWAHENKVALRYPHPVYYSVLFSDFYWSHHFYTRRPVDQFYGRFIKHQMDHAENSPNAILCLALLGEIRDLDEHVSLLSQEYSVALQAAMFFGDKIPLDTLLFEAALEAPWAFHILTCVKNPPKETVDMCQATLDFNPPWLLEYLHRSGGMKTDFAAAQARLNNALETSAHPLCADLRKGLLLKP